MNRNGGVVAKEELMATVVKRFLSQVEANLKSGEATEHTHRPALKGLFEALLTGIQAINEPKQAEYGAPDFVLLRGEVPVGHVEAKDVGARLATFVADSERATPRSREGKQLRRYREALPNLLYTDGLVWYWFVEGEARLEEPLKVAKWDKRRQRLKVLATEDELAALLEQFGAQVVATVRKPKELAERLARLARWLREVIEEVFKGQEEQGDLHWQLEAFQKTLLPNLKPKAFADMYAQTIVYGLFTARTALPDKAGFSRMDAAFAIPRTNPFLRQLFQTVAGYDLDKRIAWLVDDCANLLARTDIGEVLRYFGQATKQEDPVVHFYETFLAAYDPRLRKSRGVYYTPEPVVSYIVRSVDLLLRTHFGKPMGLADDQTIILDPATGTATFLHTVVQEIHAHLVAQGLAGAWNSYVRDKLLSRLFGFELLMAPYTVAHLKMGLLLQQLGYGFQGGERLGIYLTNTLADLPKAQIPLAFARFIAEEAEAANDVKREKEVMVVLGNPPYSGHSANKGQWIKALLRGKVQEGEAVRRVESYYEVNGAPLGERNTKWLQDDYVKFIRFAQWRISKTGEGVLAFITNNGYLDNPTFRGMRESLLNDFDEIYLLNLHGNSKKRERTPEGKPDKNVFDIQQGVAIGFFVKHKGGGKQPATVYYADLWGEREAKYVVLAAQHLGTTEWKQIEPVTPWYLFVPQDRDLWGEYQKGWKIREVMPTNVLGFQTHRDSFAIDFERAVMQKRIAEMRDTTISDEEFRAKYGVQDNRDWKLSKVRAKVRIDEAWQDALISSLYRPFDWRSCYFSEVAMDYPRRDLIDHVASKPNLALNLVRQTKASNWKHALVSDVPTPALFVEIKDGSSVFPLYLYPPRQDETHQRSLFDAEIGEGRDGRRPNLNPAFIAEVEKQLGWRFIPDGKGDLALTPNPSYKNRRREKAVGTVGPEDIFHYAYAIFYAPTYRTRYADFLKIDFPRLPLTSDRTLFAALAAKGAELVDLHLLRLPGNKGVGGAGGAKILLSPGTEGLSFPESGDMNVSKLRYVPPKGEHSGRLYINKSQYFAGIDPDTWHRRIGGYQPLHKWLKDRKKRTLSIDDIQHYLRMIIALRETRRLMGEIDELVLQWPLS
jgi:predicted helicase